MSNVPSTITKVRAHPRAHVPEPGVQPDVRAQPIGAREPGGGGAGGAPVLAARRPQLRRRAQVPPLLPLHAHLRARVPAANSRLPLRVRARPPRLRALHEQVRLRVARAHAMRPLSRVRLGHRGLHGSHGRPQASHRISADKHTPQTTSPTNYCRNNN